MKKHLILPILFTLIAAIGIGGIIGFSIAVPQVPLWQLFPMYLMISVSCVATACGAVLSIIFWVIYARKKKTINEQH